MSRVIGRLFLMPWLELTNPIRLGSFEFQQLSASETGALAGGCLALRFEGVNCPSGSAGRPVKRLLSRSISARSHDGIFLKSLQAALWKTATF